MSGSGNTPVIQETWRGGYEAMQDFGSEAEGTTIRTRHMRHGVRIVGRRNDDNELGMGHYIIGVFENGQIMYGDIIGGLLWQNERVELSGGGDREASLRETPAYAYAWPAVIVSKSKKVLKARPIFDEKLEADDRFVPLVVHSDSDLAVGRRGIVLDAVIESKQIQLFIADGADPLISHWRGEDPNDLSSLVSDIDDEGAIDKERQAPMDTAWRVSKPLTEADARTGGGLGPPETGARTRFVLRGGGAAEEGGNRFVTEPAAPPETRAGSEGGEGTGETLPPDQVLAWNITFSPSEQGFGMIVGRSLEVGLPDTPPREPEITTASTSGSVGDRYGRVTSGGSAGDDFGSSSMAVGDLALAYAGVERGGPFYVGAGEADKHWHGNNADGEPLGPAHIQANALFFATEEMDAPQEFLLEFYPDSAIFNYTVEVKLKYDADATHTYVGADGRVEVAVGLWRWHSYTPFKPCWPGIPIVRTTGPRSMVIPDEQNSGNAPGGGVPGDKLFPPRLTVDAASQKGVPFIQRIAPHLVDQAFHELAQAGNRGGRPTQVAPVEMDNEFAAPAIAFRPMKGQLAGGNLRYSEQVTIQQQQDREHSPFSLRFEAFAKQDVSSLTDWSYAEEPRQENGRYIAGTAESGGGAYLPSNFSIEDVYGVEPPANVVAAPTFTVYCRTTLSIAQFIAPELGRPVVGFDWAQDDTFSVICTAVDGAAAETLVYTLKPDGVVRFGQATEHPIFQEDSGGPLTLDETMHTALINNTTAGAFVLGLPPADATTTGRVYQIKRLNAGGAARSVDITPDGTDLIDGSGSPLQLNGQFDSVVLKSDGNGNWLIF